jgi:hypothetical protein
MTGAASNTPLSLQPAVYEDDAQCHVVTNPVAARDDELVTPKLSQPPRSSARALSDSTNRDLARRQDHRCPQASGGPPVVRTLSRRNTTPNVQRALCGSYIIITGENDRLIRLPPLFAKGETPRRPTSFKFKVIGGVATMSLTPAQNDALWAVKMGKAPNDAQAKEIQAVAAKIGTDQSMAAGALVRMLGGYGADAPLVEMLKAQCEAKEVSEDLIAMLDQFADEEAEKPDSFKISQMSNILNLLVDVEELEDPATLPPDISVTLTGKDSNYLALWRKDQPFHQKWGSVRILATPIEAADDDAADDDTAARMAAADFQLAVKTVKITRSELLRAFLIPFFVLLMQTMVIHLIYKSSQSVSVEYVTKSIGAGFIAFTEDHKCDTPFECAEEFKASQQRYDLEIQNLFHGSGADSPGVCLTDDGYWNAVRNIMLGTVIIQIFVIRDAHKIWNAPFNMATHTDPLDSTLRWLGFLVLFVIMLANYAFIVVACFYGILGEVENLAVLLHHCAAAFVVLEADDVVYKFTATKVFKAEHSACRGSTACHAVDFYRRHLDFKWSDCCGDEAEEAEEPRGPDEADGEGDVEDPRPGRQLPMAAGAVVQDPTEEDRRCCRRCSRFRCCHKEPHRGAETPNDQLGIIPEAALKFPVDADTDNIVLAFFRLGQFWETAETASKPPRRCRPANIDEVQEQRRERRGRELPRRKQCEALKNRLGVCAIAASRNVVLLVTLIGPWLPMLLHSFVYTHGFLHNTICP